jgi:hypothetical protein
LFHLLVQGFTFHDLCSYLLQWHDLCCFLLYILLVIWYVFQVESILRVFYLKFTTFCSTMRSHPNPIIKGKINFCPDDGSVTPSTYQYKVISWAEIEIYIHLNLSELLLMVQSANSYKWWICRIFQMICVRNLRQSFRIMVCWRKYSLSLISNGSAAPPPP